MNRTDLYERLLPKKGSIRACFAFGLTHFYLGILLALFNPAAGVGFAAFGSAFMLATLGAYLKK